MKYQVRFFLQEAEFTPEHYPTLREAIDAALGFVDAERYVMKKRGYNRHGKISNGVVYWAHFIHGTERKVIIEILQGGEYVDLKH
ncbi:TPA: hypothetical protein NGR52_004252 [Vibrio parahaemolyticus]|nr:hypothetical protein [Vibrio parahaemolyticus]